MSVSSEPLEALPARCSSMAPPEIDPKELVLTNKELGSGKYSKVVDGEWEGRRVAVKCFSIDGLNRTPDVIDLTDDQLRARVEKESHFMHSFSHPNICRLWGMTTLEGNSFPCLVLERGQGSLKDTLEHGCARAHAQAGRAGRRLQLRDVVRILLGVARALTYLHKRAVLHRDVSSNNVIISHDR